MTMFYRAFVEAAVDALMEEGSTCLSSDTLARAASCGFCVFTFEADVHAELTARNLPADPRQLPLQF